jgi:hypothetical protein
MREIDLPLAFLSYFLIYGRPLFPSGDEAHQRGSLGTIRAPACPDTASVKAVTSDTVSPRIHYLSVISPSPAVPVRLAIQTEFVTHSKCF